MTRFTQKLRITDKDVIALFSKTELVEPERIYLNEQANRLAYAINIIQNYCDEFTVRSVLDVGPHFLTRCIKEFVRPELYISTLGYEYSKLVPSDMVEEHVTYNLIDCVFGKPITFKTAPFDLIIFCEVIEHIFISPILVLEMLKSLMPPQSGGLLIQTPNAVCIKKRVQMLCGRNPFEMPGTDFQFKEHIREYTMKEIEQFGRIVGLSVWKKEYCRYWPHLYNGWIERAIEAMVPNMRQGLTVLFRY